MSRLQRPEMRACVVRVAEPAAAGLLSRRERAESPSGRRSGHLQPGPRQLRDFAYAAQLLRHCRRRPARWDYIRRPRAASPWREL